MKRLLITLVAVFALLHAPAWAEPRVYDAPTLEALAAPIALYPDSVISQILAAAAQPQPLAEAAARPGLDDPSWPPSVRALEPFPELLQQMAESPQWLADLAWAAQSQRSQLMQAVQALRQRAYAAGHLRSDEQHNIVLSGQAIYVTPAASQLVFLPYYDPFVVYGAWRPVQRIAVWRPWPARTYFVQQQQQRAGPNGAPSTARQLQLQQQQQYEQRQREQQRPRQQLNFTPYVPVPESQRRPFVHSDPMPPARLPVAGGAHDHRDSGRRHYSGAGGNAPHAGSAHPGHPRVAGEAPARVHTRGTPHRT